MTFWYLYTPALLIAIAFFVYSLRAYVQSRRVLSTSHPPASDAVLPEGWLVSLVAQHLLAPKLALQDATSLLATAGASLDPIPVVEGIDDFEAALQALSHAPGLHHPVVGSS